MYWSISRAPRPGPGATEAIAFVASVKYGACNLKKLMYTNFEFFFSKLTHPAPTPSLEVVSSGRLGSLGDLKAGDVKDSRLVSCIGGRQGVRSTRANDSQLFTQTFFTF